MKYFLIFIALTGFITSFSLTFAGEAEKINITHDNKIMTADYFQGEPDKASIFILHGFLLTHNFHTVKRLAESLHDSGYSVLTPTLSLDINKRVKSLACEAIHTHALEKDLAEIDLWLKWLKKKSHNKIVLIGHSTGSLHLTWYLSDYLSPQIEQVIFLSIPDFGPSSFTYETEELANKAIQLVKNNDHSLQEFGLSYCQKYATTAQNYLSYYNLSKDNIVKRLKKIPINKTLIYGTQDKRIDKQWNQELVQLDIEVITIESANHFFDFEHEFDLLDNIEEILSRLN